MIKNKNLIKLCNVNKFDKLLKENLYYDLLFRTIIWVLIALTSGFFAINLGDSTVLSYLESVGGKLAPLIDKIGGCGLLICLLALFLKDLEVVSKNQQTIASVSGMTGGFVRRLAAEISSWTLGALITLLSTMVLAILNTTLSKNDIYSVSRLALILVSMAALTAFANVQVRSSDPNPWVFRFDKAAWLVVVYAFCFAFLIRIVIRTVI